MEVLLRYEHFLLLLYNNNLNVDQDAFVRGIMHRTTSEEQPRTSLKRKVGYVEEQVSATRARMAEMQIDVRANRPEKENENELLD
jgi:hypothetical protein